MPSLLCISRSLWTFAGLNCPLQTMGGSTAVCGLCLDVLLLINPPFLSQKGLLTAVQTYFVFFCRLHPDTLDSFLVLLQLFFWQILYLQTDSLSPRCSTQPCLYTSEWVCLHPEFYRSSPTTPPFFSPHPSDEPKREAGYLQVPPRQGTNPWETF